MRLNEVLSKESIQIHGAAEDQIDAITQLIGLQEKNGKIQDAAAYRRAVYEREDITSTALDGGLAIPHANSQAVTGPCVSFLSLKKGVDWGAYDHSRSDLLFLIGAPEEGNLHLYLLTYLTTLFTLVPGLAEQLRTASVPEEVLACLEEAEGACRAELDEIR